MLIDGLDLIEGSINNNLVITNVTAAQKAVATQIDVGEIVFQTDGVSGLYIYHGSSLGWKLISTAVDVNDATNLTTGTLAAARLPATTVTTGAYGSATAVPTYTVDATGRLTAAANVNIAITSSDVSGLAASATTDTTNATNITTGTLAAARISDLGTPASGNLTNCTVDGTNKLGYLTMPAVSQTANYTTVLSDSGKYIFHPSTDATARTFTIPANSSVAYPIGTVISFVNMSAQNVSIAITSDTMYLAELGTTGTRTLAQYGTATALKIDTTVWLISGAALT